jgi:gamma-glutamyltranspeptidase/glutathione hydrolase
MPSLGWDSVTVPGAVSAWVALSKRYGKLPFETLFEAGIRYARESFMVSPITAASWARQAPNFKGFSEFCWTFLPKDRAPVRGRALLLPAAGETLEDIASTKGESFYRGPIAERIALASQSDDGRMTLEDLAAHRADWIEPISVEYRGYHLHEMPPNCQGIAALSGARDPAPLRRRVFPRRFRRQPPSADRGGEARPRRRVGSGGRCRRRCGSRPRRCSIPATSRSARSEST